LYRRSWREKRGACCDKNIDLQLCGRQKCLWQRDQAYFGPSVLHHRVKLMLEDIGQIPFIKNTIKKARSLTAFIYGQTRNQHELKISEISSWPQ
jgi:hypothetical protein